MFCHAMAGAMVNQGVPLSLMKDALGHGM